MAYQCLRELDDNPVFKFPREAALVRTRELQHASSKDLLLRGIPFRG